MTSTVLDVTVMLLCVSASVVALGAADGDHEVTGPEAADVADLIATETVTVTYASAEAPNGTRTVHATRAELLALVVAGGEGGGEKRAPREAFESRALGAVERGVGPRTRIDAEVGTKTSDAPTSERGDESGTVPPEVGTESSHWAANSSALPTRPRGLEFDSDGPDRDSTVTTRTGIPWYVEREGSSDGGAETEDTASESGSAESIAVGTEPPRGADVTVAVITHPAPDSSGSTAPVRIVIRRW